MVRAFGWLVIFKVCILTACGSSDKTHFAHLMSEELDRLPEEMRLKLTSPLVEDGQPIPREFSGEGSDRSPPIAWSEPANKVAEYALIVTDPDAPAGDWIHWVLYNIPAEVTSLPAGLPRESKLSAPFQARQGRNSWSTNNIGYRGPMPPRGDGRHRYFFTVFGLDTHLDLDPDIATAETLMSLIQGHIIAGGQLMGTYER